MTDNTQIRLAYDRTHLANERTFAAWVRTGLSLAAAGFGVTRLSPESGSAGRWAHTIGLALAVLGGAAIVIGLWSFRKMRVRLREEWGEDPTPSTGAAIYALALLLLVVILLALPLA